jgi:hypothetical protein
VEIAFAISITMTFGDSTCNTMMWLMKCLMMVEELVQE